MRAAVLSLIVSLTAFHAQAAWKAAVAKAVITPDKPLWMAGYSSRKTGAIGKLQDLFAKVLVLEDEKGARVAIITLDLIGVPKPLRVAVAAEAQAKFKLPPSHLLLNASHTHSGPMIRVVRPVGQRKHALAAYDAIPADQRERRVRETLEYNTRLQKTMIDLISRCIKNLQPAKLGYSHARCGFAMNRRLPVNGCLE